MTLDLQLKASGGGGSNTGKLRNGIGQVGGLVGAHLTEGIYQLVVESKLPHKTVNLFFTFTNQNNKLTILWGG